VTNLPIDSCVAPTNPNIVNSELWFLYEWRNWIK
jgi:hypothetical protein